MATSQVTANVPGFLREVVERQWKAERYPSRSDYAVGLILWDIYSRQPHKITGSLMREPTWVLTSFVRTLLEELGEPSPPPGDVMPWRFNLYVPKVLMPIVRQRWKEERYGSSSKYVTGLIIYDLKYRAPHPKKVPHHKTAPLLREPDFVRDAVIAQLAEDFGNPSRVWPKGIEGRIDELVLKQRELPLR